MKRKIKEEEKAGKFRDVEIIAVVRAKNPHYSLSSDLPNAYAMFLQSQAVAVYRAFDSLSPSLVPPPHPQPSGVRMARSTEK